MMSSEKLPEIRSGALRLLKGWAQGAETYWFPRQDDPSIGCYGPGYQHWGVQSNFNYVAALATLAVHSEAEDGPRWRQRALSALRYAMATHETGLLAGGDGKRWGNTWISMLGIERAMHGVAHLQDDLTDADRDAMHRLLTSEADWLLQPSRGRHTGVCAGLWGHAGCNNPESNIWSGCLLWRVAERYPGEKHADAWREQACRFLMNGISVEADASDRRLVAGKPVSAWHIGPNFFPHYGLDHHGYLNVGYMVICTSHAAILHFDCKQSGGRLPEFLYHHQADLWQVLRRFIFGDGRLARIGGDSRVRYAYCQEYLLPSLLFAADHLGDAHAMELVGRQLQLMEAEADTESGLFYARRLARLRDSNPHYYTRLESDRACVLAMLLNHLPWVEQLPKPEITFEESVAGIWCEDEHAAAMHRSPGRLASFVWRARGLTQALCLPPGDGSLAEWELNLCPVVRFMGDDGTGRHRQLLDSTITSFEGGFVTCGSVREGVNVSIDEGASCTDQAVTHVAFAALPDGRTCVCLQYVVAAVDRVVYLQELKDLHCVVPNDILNGNRRTLACSSGLRVLTAPPAQDAVMDLESHWVHIDDSMGMVALYGGDRMLLDRSRQRRAGRYQSLFTEAICLHIRRGITRCKPGEVLSDVGFAVVSGVTAGTTASVQGGPLALDGQALRGVWIAGGNGKRYALVANFSSGAQLATVDGVPIELSAGMAVVREIA